MLAQVTIFAELNGAFSAGVAKRVVVPLLQVLENSEFKMTVSDHPNFAPFVLTKTSQPSLLLSDRGMALKTPIFEAQGRLGGGYDWASVARVILVERLPDLVDVIKFDSEAGMFAAYAPPAAIVRLGAEMLRAYKDDGILRDFLSRAELD